MLPLGLVWLFLLCTYSLVRDVIAGQPNSPIEYTTPGVRKEGDIDTRVTQNPIPTSITVTPAPKGYPVVSSRSESRAMRQSTGTHP